MLLKLYRPEGSDFWYYSGTVAGDRLRGSTRTKDKKAAAKAAHTIASEHYDRSVHGSKQELKFPQAVDRYEKAGKIANFRTEAYVMKLVEFWKNTPVKDITVGAIRQSALTLYPGCSGATWNRQVITPTQAIINHCAELGLCAPVRVKRFPFEKKIKAPVTLDWLDMFCAHAEPRIAALATFMFATGCRISEARRVEWADIDFPNRAILLRMTKTKRQRLSHIPQRLLVELANLPRDTGPFDVPEMTLRRAWDSAVDAAGIQRLTFHSCRHGFATTLLQDGVDVVTVAKLGGWDSPQQVLATYAHAVQDATLTDRLFLEKCQTLANSPQPLSTKTKA